MGVAGPIRTAGHQFWTRWRGAFPTILFYVVLFLAVTFLFGSQYAMVVASTTTLFQIRRQCNNTWGYYGKLLVSVLFLGLLAFLAGRNAVLCVALNFIVPFALVFLQSDQFTPKGYFGYAMTFVFLELRPPTPAEFPVQMLVLLLCTLALIGALILYARLFSGAEQPEAELSLGMTRLAELLEELAGGGGAEARRELEELAQRYRRQGYARRREFRWSDQRRLYYLFALLFQRLSYLISDGSWAETRANPACGTVLRTLAGLVRQLRDAETAEERAALKMRLRVLQAEERLPPGRLRIFYRSFLHRMLLLLREGEPRPGRFRLPWREAAGDIRRRLTLSNFEVRFALRLSVVLTVSCTVSLLWDFEHTYWFPLHAFLLLQPSYEESAQRMVTRPVGTAIGCVVVHLAYPWLPGVPGSFAFALVMISLMYCCTPGTWVHPIFSTSFALTLTTMTLERSEAIQLRLFYLGLAVALVLLVNSFLLPTRRSTQFRYNLRTLLRLQAAYWGLVRGSLRGSGHPERSGELLAYFHLVYHEAAVYAAGLPAETAARFKELLLTLWNLLAQVEQVECLVLTGELGEEEYGVLDRLAEALQDQLNPPQPALARPAEECTLPPGPLRRAMERYRQGAEQLLETWTRLTV